MHFTMNKNGFQTNTEYGELKISSDDQYGFRPYQLMVSSVAVCSGGVLRNILQKMRIPFDGIKITANVERNEDQANRIEKIHLTFHLHGSDIKPEKVEKALGLTEKNCAMVQSVKDSIHVTEDFEIHER